MSPSRCEVEFRTLKEIVFHDSLFPQKNSKYLMQIISYFLLFLCIIKIYSQQIHNWEVDSMGYNTKETIENLTLEQLQAFVEELELKGFVTDECKIINGNNLVTPSVIADGGPLLIKRLQEELEYPYGLGYTSVYDLQRGAVAGLCSFDWYDDITDFRERGLLPFIEKLNKIDPY